MPAPPTSAPGPVTAHHLPLPIGPSSLPLTGQTTLDFAQQASGALEKAKTALEELESRLAALGEDDGEGRKRVEERCSLDNERAATSALYADFALRADLQQLLLRRWVPLQPPLRVGGRRRGGRGRSQTVEEEGEDEDEEDEEEEEGAERGKNAPRVRGEMTESSLGGPVNEEAVELVKEADEGPLRLLRKPPFVGAYLRKAKLGDYQSLAAVRPADPVPSVPTAPDPAPPVPAPLSSLLYTLTLHPVPRSSHLSSTSASAAAAESARSRFIQTPQKQVLVCLGTTTLEEVARAVVGAREAVPREVPSPAEAGEEAAAGTDEEGEDDPRPHVDNFGAHRAGVGAGERAEGEERPTKRRRTTEKSSRWTAEKRTTGCAFVVEGVVYAAEKDEERGRRDYAEMLTSLISSTDWSTSSADPSKPSRPLPRPELRAGPTTDLARLGELEELRTGEPYLFLTGGNVELVWSVQEIRYLHPLDPPPSSTSYPLTTYLSRPYTSSTASASLLPSASSHTLGNATALTGLNPLAAWTCRVCEKEPASCCLVEDEMVGETPCPVCEGCLEVLHPHRRAGEDEDEQDEEGEDVGEMEKGRRFMVQGPPGARTRVRVVPILVI
ncbi:hypothetical protein JCM8097_008060 [Rhodosporidiobolus ruineniae]